MSDASELKNLQVTLNTIDQELQSAHAKMGILKTDINNLKQARESTVNKLSKHRGLQITEHALLRLCERKFGIPMDKVEEGLKAILEPMLVNVVSGKFPIGDGLRAVINQKKLITIEPA